MPYLSSPPLQHCNLLLHHHLLLCAVRSMGGGVKERERETKTARIDIEKDEGSHHVIVLIQTIGGDGDRD